MVLKKVRMIEEKKEEKKAAGERESDLGRTFPPRPRSVPFVK